MTRGGSTRDEEVRLRRDVRFIPMMNGWYPTPLLISPMTFGLVTKRSHLPTMESFVEAPDVHRACVATPELRGGPFINYGGPAADVARHIQDTRDACSAALQRADDMESLFAALPHAATGGGLRAAYRALPQTLSGAVELQYDTLKQPGVRFVESDLYRRAEREGHAALQSGRLELATKQERPFFLSTPLLARSEGAVDLRVPFSDPLWDRLFSRSPQRRGELQEIFASLTDDPRSSVDNLFERPDSSPGCSAPALDGSTRVRYFGHACVLMESDSHAVLVDPLISYPGESDLQRWTFDDLPSRIDYVLITHGHVDHFVLETLIQLRHRIGCVVVGRAAGGDLQDVSLKLALQHCGFRSVVELGDHEEIAEAGLRIVAAPFFGEHADLDIRAKASFGVTLGASTCAFFADSNPPDPECYRGLREMLPPIDCMFIGMECVGAPATWSYGSLLQATLTRDEDQSRRLDGSNADTATRMRDFLQPRRSFVYAMGAEPWVTHLSSIVYSEDLQQFKEARRFERETRARGLHAEVLYGSMDMRC